MNEIEYLKSIIERYQMQEQSCNYTVAFWAVEWLDSFKKPVLRSTSYEKYNRLIHKYIIPLFGHLTLDRFDILQAQKILNNINLSSVKDDCYSLLSEMFEKATRIGYINRNYIKALEIKKRTKEHNIAFTRADERKFINKCKDNKYGLIFIIGMNTGLRRGELLGLTADSIDLKNRYIYVGKQYQYGNITAPKTNSSIRNVPIFDELYEVLKNAKLPKSGRLFPISETTIRFHFNDIIEKSKLTSKGYTIHSMRHTFCTRCAERGMEIHVTQKWTGHSDLKTLMEIYQHCNDDTEKREIKKYNKGGKKYK